MNHDGLARRLSLEDVVAQVAVPAGIQAEWTGVAPELSAGQVWRARWRDQVQLVITLSIDRTTTVLPLSFDHDYVDATSVLIAADASPFGVPTVAWPTLKRSVPNAVLDRFAGWLDSQTADGRLLGELEQHRDDQSTPQSIRIYRALIEDIMDEFSAARLHGDGSGELGTLLQASGLRVQDVAETLGTTPQRALAIWRGMLPLSEQEAGEIAPSLGESAENIFAANPTPPSALVECMEDPKRHHQVLAYAATRNFDIATAYRDLFYQTWVLAARQTGDKTTNWDLRLDTLFAAVLNEQ